jgi:hypothetical protein
VLSGALNLVALGFTVAFSGFLLLGVDWHALLHEPCIAQVLTPCQACTLHSACMERANLELSLNKFCQRQVCFQPVLSLIY